MQDFIDEAKQWCAGKQWWWRLIILLGFGFIFVGHLMDPNYSSILGALNLLIHEGGHLLFGWAGQFMAIAGGTITQLAAPIFGIWNFRQQDDFFGMSLSLGWLSTNLFNVATYVNDAQTMELDLVSVGGGEVIHDWNYMLSHTGLLTHDHAVAGFFWLLAVLSMFACLITGSWLLWQMAVSSFFPRCNKT